MLELLLSPIDPSRAHEVGFHLSWHARLMVVAWAVFVPVGIIIARFFKVWRRGDWPAHVDDQRWWVAHRSFQYGATGLTLAGLYLILTAPALTSSIGGPHRVLGWAIVALTAVQVLGGLLRGTKGGPTDTALRGDHYDMTPRRLMFETVHKTAGYLALIVAIAAILSGLWQSNAPLWMFVVLPVWWLVLAAVFWRLHKSDRWIDTYQAIWGPSPEHPGNRSTTAPGE